MTLDLALNGLKAAQPPHLVGDVLILSYQPDRSANVRFVGARFETENYAILHTFLKNQYGVFVLDYEVPGEHAGDPLPHRCRRAVDERSVQPVGGDGRSGHQDLRFHPGQGARAAHRESRVGKPTAASPSSSAVRRAGASPSRGISTTGIRS